jgi:hypothetical protein
MKLYFIDDWIKLEGLEPCSDPLSNRLCQPWFS